MRAFFTRPYLLTLYLFLSIATLLAHILLPLLIFVFPFVFLVRIKRVNFLYSIFLIGSFNILFFISYLGIFSLLRIPIASLPIALFNILLAGGLLFYRKKLDSVRFDPPAHANILALSAIYLFFILALVVRVVSVAKFPAPILHDPVADSIWTKSLMDNHSINYFYSPGLHMVTGFVSQAFGLSIPHALNLVTNGFNAFSVLSWGLVAALVTRRAAAGIATAFITFIIPVPSLLYVNSGKNALVMAIAFIPVVLYALYRNYKLQNLFNNFLLLFSLAALFLIHYPTFGYTFLSVLTLSAVFSLSFFAKRLGAEYAGSLRPLLVLGAVLLFLACWFLLQSKGLSDNTALAAPTNYSDSIRISPGEIKASFVNNYREFNSYSRFYSSYYMPIMMVAVILFLGLRSNMFWLTAAIFSFWIVAVPFFINLLQLKSLDIIRSSGVLLFFQAFTFIVSTVAIAISKGIKFSSWAKYLFLVAGGIILLWISMYQYTSYRDRTKNFETVDSYDLAAYTWINQNDLPGNFLINANLSAHRSIVFPSDGGMWIPAYTNSDVSVNFSRARDTKDLNSYQRYLDIKAGKNVQKDIDEFKKEGYRYYYYDRGVFGSPIPTSAIENYSSLVYSNPEVKIYKFN